MGSYGDNRGGGDRWQGREDRGHGRGYRGDDDRGFLDRAGDELRSWFGDDEAQHRREMDQRRWEQEQRMTGPRDNDYGRGDDQRRSDRPGGSFGGGWGNQRGESWNRERPGERGWSGTDEFGGGERRYAPGEREGWFSDSRGGERGERYGGGFGQGSGRSSRTGATSRDEGRGGGGGGDRTEGFGGDVLRGGGGHDPHYSEWRRRQIEDLDRDYDEWRREHQSRFEQEFGSWRSQRQSQRQALSRVAEHMEVVGSDGTHVGAVDKVRGDRIILTRSDAEAGGVHHSVPCSWVESIDDKVTLNRSAEEARAAWRSEDAGQALFDREGGRGEGGGNLNRAFSGTYDEGSRRDDSGDRRD